MLDPHGNAFKRDIDHSLVPTELSGRPEGIEKPDASERVH
jgi:hypothetical protein